MAEILLSSEQFVKDVSGISENIAGKYILPALREAQEQGLKGILGESLISRLKALVRAKTIDSHPEYKELLDRCQYYLAYTAIAEGIIPRVSYKVGNFGVAKSNDEQMTLASQDEIAKMQFFYQSKADACCFELQNFILENRNNYPELSENHCNKIQSNLYSAASCGIWLGGPRGKGVASKCGGHRK